MQFQADVLGSPVVAPEVAEITATGAAYAAGLATGFWAGLDELRANYTTTHRWEPAIGGDERARGVAAWRQGIDRTLNLVTPGARGRRRVVGGHRSDHRPDGPTPGHPVAHIRSGSMPREPLGQQRVEANRPAVKHRKRRAPGVLLF